ncbi:MAG: mechanosensitive ion channel [Proteobacteria bacterium]|nr:mechanosensitive ion channel [Pseudomonadota bacterium]
MTKYFRLLIFFIIIVSPLISNSQNDNTKKSDGGDVNSTQTEIDSIGAENDISVNSIERINGLLESTQQLIIKVEGSIENNKWEVIDSVFTIKDSFLNDEYEYFSTRDKQSLSKFFLSNMSTTWSNYRIQIKKWQTELDYEIALNAKNSTSFLDNKRTLEKLYRNLVDADFPTLTKRITAVISDIDATIRKYHLYEQQLLSLQSRIYDKDFLCEEVLKEIAGLEVSLRDKTFTKTKPLIWNIHLKETIENGFKFQLEKAIANNNKSIEYYFISIGTSIFKYLFFIILIISIFLFIRRSYQKIGTKLKMPGHTNVERVLISHPKSVIISLVILVWFVLFPFIPLFLSDILVLILLFSFFTISKIFNDNFGKKIISVLIALFMLNIFEVIIWYLGDYSRIYLLFETSVALFLIHPLFIQYLKKTVNKNSSTDYIAKKLIPLAIMLYTIAFFANILGFINLTVLFIKIAIRSSAIIMIAIGFSRIFINISFAWISLIDAKLPEFYLKYGDKLNKRFKGVINFVVFILCAEYLLNIFEIKAVIHEKIGTFLTHKLAIGSLSLSLLNIILFIGILYITFLITLFIKKIIEKEILRKMRMPRGVPAAISMILRIFFVTFGILFALSAAEIKMSNIVVLIGALGVGIGFGLQNIVLNFISGLILIFERPIQTGDTIEVNTLVGRVKDIGIRASNITTYDGAEVVVPNSNLISNELINWTLSDSKRRVEIKVGTAYGSDPNQVLELLKKVALNNPDVYKDPPPRPLFEGFGDSSLNFRLLCWVHYENGLAAQSDIAIGIYNILAENNIQIPFPQVDLHVKNLPAENDVKLKNDDSDK